MKYYASSVFKADERLSTLLHADHFYRRIIKLYRTNEQKNDINFKYAPARISTSSSNKYTNYGQRHKTWSKSIQFHLNERVEEICFVSYGEYSKWQRQRNQRLNEWNKNQQYFVNYIISIWILCLECLIACLLTLLFYSHNCFVGGFI